MRWIHVSVSHSSNATRKPPLTLHSCCSVYMENEVGFGGFLILRKDFMSHISHSAEHNCISIGSKLGGEVSLMDRKFQLLH